MLIIVLLLTKVLPAVQLLEVKGHLQKDIEISQKDNRNFAKKTSATQENVGK